MRVSEGQRNKTGRLSLLVKVYALAAKEAWQRQLEWQRSQIFIHCGLPPSRVRKAAACDGRV